MTESLCTLATCEISMSLLGCSRVRSSELKEHLAKDDRSARSKYDAYAPSYDRLDGGYAAQMLGFPRLRQELLSEATGSVLECAVGTGLNLPWYDYRRLNSLTAIDISQGMLAQAKEKAKFLDFETSKVRFQEADVTNMSLFPDDSFDTVVDTFSLCVFRDPSAALREMTRVVKPNGKILLLEHNRSRGLLGMYQDLTAFPVKNLGGKGCLYNQDVMKLVLDADMTVYTQKEYLGGLVIRISATKHT